MVEPDNKIELSGLSSQEVEKLKKEGKTNKTKKHVTKTYSEIIIGNVFNFFNIVLFVIAGIMIWAAVGWPGKSNPIKFTSFAFLAILILNVLIGLIQDVRARILVDKLRLVTEPKAKVIRDGKETQINIDEIVLGDVVKLDIGDQIPADSILVEGFCSCDESMLTGEAVPIKKAIGDHLFAASFLTKGHCYVKVEKVGSDNYAETLQKQASFFKRPKSEIKNGINRIFAFAGIASIVIGLMMVVSWFLTTFVNDKTIFTDPNNLEFPKFVSKLSGSMVSMIPAGLYLLTSLTLAVGVIMLSKKKMLVQELYCIEMLARVDVLCLDKTGTLTDGRMSVSAIIPIGDPNEVNLAASFVTHATGDKNPTALALLDRFPGAPELEVLATSPFDSETKYSAATTNGRTYVLGAYGFVDSNKVAKAENGIKDASENGYRVLCVYRNPNELKNGKIQGKSTLIGYVLIEDHIKEDAARNIAWFKGNGVAVKIISGDSPVTVSSIAKRVGLDNPDLYVSCEGKSNDELKELALTHSIFGRVTPEQKEIIVKALQEAGHTVGMTGDGVNDILALKAADCSIAMASGSDAAKNVSHLVSLNDDFSRLPDVVDQGRRVINNLQRTCSLFLSKTFFAVALSLIFLISSLIPGGDSYPFMTNNMFAWEYITIGISAFFLALQPSHEKLKSSFLKNILVKALPAGIVEVLAVLMCLACVSLFPNFLVHDGASAYELAFVTLSVISFSSVSVVVLLKVCMPLNKYRTVVFFSMAAATVLIFSIDFFARASDGRGYLMRLNWDGFNYGFAIAAIVIPAACGGIYFFINWGIEKIASKLTKGEIK